MLVKVYAKCCNVNQYIQEVDQDDLIDAIQEIYEDAEDRNIINTVDEKLIEKYLTEIHEYFNQNKRISVGDYMIMEVESLNDVTIPNCLGWDTQFIF